jgi:hypothetical protein
VGITASDHVRAKQGKRGQVHRKGTQWKKMYCSLFE